MVYIYILQLVNNKYYVGKTIDPKFRLDQHFNSDGSCWTRKYKPIKVLELIPNCDNFDEDKYTLKTMENYGITNVRGGSFCELILSKDNISTIKKMLIGSTDKCYICGESGHFASNCNQDDDPNYQELVNLLIDNNCCFRCYRPGHYASDCYAKKTITGDEIVSDSEEEVEVYLCEYCGKEFETEKGALYHEKVYCKSKPNPKSKINIKTKSCSRCGRTGHNELNCYAKTTVGGDEIDSDEDDEEFLKDTCGFCCDYCGKSFETLKGSQYHQRFYCKK